jgi:hypothetical protein
LTFLDGGVPNASSFLQFHDDNEQNISFKSQLNLVDSNAKDVLQMNNSDRGSKVERLLRLREPFKGFSNHLLSEIRSDSKQHALSTTKTVVDAPYLSTKG